MNHGLFDPGPFVAPKVEPKVVREICPECRGAGGLPMNGGYVACRACMARGWIAKAAQ